MNIYNISNNFPLTNNIPRNENLFTQFILASPRLNCLFLVEKEYPKFVYQYNIMNNVISQCIRFPEKGFVMSVTLTNTDDILTSFVHPSEIKEYSSKGYFIRSITLDSSIEYLSYSIKLRNNQFLISHGGFIGVHRVCLLNKNGGIIQYYGRLRGIGIGQLHYPRMLVVDRHDNVLVADTYNNRVVLLSPSLTHLGYIAMPQQLSAPSALFLDEFHNRLYIGDVAGRVFELNQRSK